MTKFVKTSALAALIFLFGAIFSSGFYLSSAIDFKSKSMENKWKEVTTSICQCSIFILIDPTQLKSGFDDSSTFGIYRILGMFSRTSVLFYLVSPSSIRFVIRAEF